MPAQAQDRARAQHEMKAVIAVRFLQRRGRRFAEDGARGQLFLQPSVQRLRGKTRALLVRRADDDEHEVREGRIIPLLAVLNLLLPKAVEIVMPRVLDRGAERRE